MRKLKVGDIVRLKSGGPDMTIESIESLSFMGADYNCQWFTDKKLVYGSFKEETLEVVKIAETNE
jgi:uncharacterized protein YodC (DUF2158 family)